MKVYTTGTLARAAGISDRTIANYADAGLLPVVRDESGRRLFEEDALRRVREIWLERQQRRGRGR